MRPWPTVGTRSVLWGAHQFLIHPLFVALAWWRLWGWATVKDPHVGAVSLRDPLLWVAFFVHDLGYVGKPNMDGTEGEEHPEWGARFLSGLVTDDQADEPPAAAAGWYRFVKYHSRFLSRRDSMPYSKLCVADKLAVALEPWWLYLPRVIASGELWEYLRHHNASAAGTGKYAGDGPGRRVAATSWRAWHRLMVAHCRRWALEHKGGKQDGWTP